ncbi:MAG: WD40 repeat domain-containing protein, partial [Candidatus Hodarchaeota archaeon]
PKSSAVTVAEKWRYSFTSELGKVAISKNGNYIIALNVSTATFFDRNSNSSLWRFDLTGKTGFYEVAISEDGQYIALTNDTDLYFLDKTVANPKQEIWKYIINNDEMHIDMSDDGYYIAVGSEQDDSVYLFNRTLKTPKTYEWNYTLGFNPYSIAISGNGQYIAAGGWDHYIYVFNTSDYQGVPMWKYDTTNTVYHLSFSEDGQYLVTGNDADEEVYFFNVTDYQGVPMWNYTRDELSGSDLKDLDISGDGNYVAIAYDDDAFAGDPEGVVCLLNKTLSNNKLPEWSKKPFISTSDTDYYMESIAFSNDENYIVAGYSQPTSPTPSYSSVLLYDREGLIWEGLNYTNDFYVKSVSISEKGDYFAVAEDGVTRHNLHLFYHPVPSPSGPSYILPAADDDNDDEEQIDLTLPIVLTIVFVSIGGGIAIIYVLIKKGIIDISKLKR